MTPSFEIANTIILSMIDGNFNGDLTPFVRNGHVLVDEANRIALGDPSDAIEYLADGTTILNSMIFSLREARYGVGKNQNLQLELAEMSLCDIYKHFLDLLTKIQQPLN